MNTLAKEIEAHLENLTKGFVPVFRGIPHFHSHVLQLAEKALFLRVLIHTRGKISSAAKILGMNRNTLSYRIYNLNINIERMREVNGWHLTGKPEGQRARVLTEKARYPLGCR